MDSDIRIVDVKLRFDDERLRTPLKFGIDVVEAVTKLTVCVTVENRQGHRATGHGAVLLSDLWAFPTKAIGHEVRDLAMRRVSEQFAKVLSDGHDYGHPIDFYYDRHTDLERICRDVTDEMALVESLPILAGLVCASPMDAAIHDAFGNANGISTYDHGYGREFCPELSRWLGDRYKGRYLSDYLKDAFETPLPIFHLVGGLDKLTADEVDDSDPDDGLPVSLDQWIERDGVFCLKVKLRGHDLDWDVDRIVAVGRAARQVLPKRGCNELYMSCDSNETCPNADHVVEMVRKVAEKDPQAGHDLLYVEQPTERELGAHRFDMHELATLKPVVADEGVTDMDLFDLAVELGWSGIALKTCKGLSSALLYQARCKEEGLQFTVQDLTLPGISFLHSAGFAARIGPMKGVEYNARQYLPFSSEEERPVHDAAFTVQDGLIRLDSLGGTGLGARVDEWMTESL